MPAASPKYTKWLLAKYNTEQDKDTFWQQQTELAWHVYIFTTILQKDLSFESLHKLC